MIDWNTVRTREDRLIVADLLDEQGRKRDARLLRGRTAMVAILGRLFVLRRFGTGQARRSEVVIGCDDANPEQPPFWEIAFQKVLNCTRAIYTQSDFRPALPLLAARLWEAAGTAGLIALDESDVYLLHRYGLHFQDQSPTP